MKNISQIAQATFALSFVVLCGCQTSSIPGTSHSAGSAGAALAGKAMGGQQPVNGATIQIYAVGTTGDGSTANALLTSTVTTNAAGNFSIPAGAYTCPSSSTFVYLTATGGNPGLTAGTNNTSLSLMTALGACGSLSSSTYISVNEVTTVGSLAALYPYATSYSAIGSSTSGSGAAATATVSTCDVVGVTVTYAGSGYTAAPTVTFTPTSGGSGATAYTTTAGTSPTETVASVVMTNPGSGYSAAPTVTFSTPTGTSPAVATGTATMDSCVTGYTITNAGSGYTTAPEVIFSGGGGEGAEATATLTSGAVTGITITNAGEGYTSAPALSFSSSSGGDSQKLANAFSLVNEYTNTMIGTAPGLSLPSGYYASTTEINTLADVIAACINSSGGTAGDGSACGKLFTYATVGGTAPTDTIGAVINILNNPTSNVSSIYVLATSTGPFKPTLSTSPSYWTLPIIASEPTLPLSLPATGTYTITLASNSALAWDNKTETGQGFNNAADGIYICPTGTGCSGTFVASEQQFALTAAGNGTYVITNVNSGGELLTFGANPGMVSQDSGFTVGSDNWVWTIVPASSGSGYLLYDNWTPGEPVDADGTGTTVASGNLLYVKTYTGGTSQVWNITPATGNSCPVITPQIWTSTNGWQNTNSVSVPPGVEVSLSGAPTAVGTWSWTGTGSNNNSTSILQTNVPLSSGTNTFTATYSNSCGTPSTATYTVNVGQPTLTAGACDILNTAGTPCGAAYSLTRRMFAAYTGNLFQVERASDNTTLNVGSSSATGQVNTAPIASFCSGTSCYFSEIYDQTANAANLTSSATTASMALYQTSPYNGLPILQTTAPATTTAVNYSTPSATATTTYYRNLSGSAGIPSGTPTNGISAYYVRTNYALVGTEGDFGDMDSTVANSGVGHRFAIGYSSADGVATNTTGAYYCLDLENVASTAYSLNCGASGTAPTIDLATATSLPSPPTFTLIGKYTYNATLASSSIAIEMADATQGGLSTLYSAAPAQAPNLGGGVSLGEGADGKIAYTSFQEGAIIPSTITADASLQANIAAFYGQPALTTYATNNNYQGPGDIALGASGWWGLRAYNNAYAASLGPAIQVTPAGGTSTTINVTATGDLNVAAAQAACQNTVCFITEFYDQTGGGHNMTQTNVDYEPQLIFNCANGAKVCAFYSTLADNSLAGFETTLDATIPQPFTLNAVYDKTNELYPSFGVLLSSYGGGTGAYDEANFTSPLNEAAQTVVDGGTANLQPAHSYVFQSMTSEFNGVTVSPFSPVYINGLESNFNPNGTGGTAGQGFGPHIAMGENYGGGQPMMGFIQEAGVWNSALTATTVSNLSNNQRAYWQF